jgi:hypothetical protein
MSFLGEVLFDLVMSLDLEAPFGRYAYTIFGTISLVAAGMSAWVFWASSTPMNNLPGGLILFACSILFGALGLLASGIHLTRKDVDKGQTTYCFVSSLLAVLVPLLGIAR